MNTVKSQLTEINNFKKLIIIFIFILFILSGCGFKDKIQIFSSGKTVNKQDYILYTPSSGKAAKKLVYILSPSGTKKSASAYINIWKNTADENNYILASPIDWDHKVISKTLQEVKNNNNIEKVFITGFSNGGYNACHFGLKNQNLIDGIIPMGAYCSKDSIQEKIVKKTPILIVVGEKDTWARGGDLKMIKRRNAEFNKIGWYPEVVIIPGAGHVFPSTSLPQAAKWINDSH